jgi:hypothetical protein
LLALEPCVLIDCALRVEFDDDSDVRGGGKTEEVEGAGGAAAATGAGADLTPIGGPALWTVAGPAAPMGGPLRAIPPVGVEAPAPIGGAARRTPPAPAAPVVAVSGAV